MKSKVAAGRVLQSIALIFLSAGIFLLCVAGKPLPWLAWIVMAPLFFLLGRVSVLRGALLAGLFAWLIWIASVWWLYAPFHDMLGMSVASAVALTLLGCLLMAVPYALAAAIVCRWRRKVGLLGCARDAAIFTMAITWFTPVFQGSIVHTQYRYPIVLQVLELGGAPLLLFLMLWVNRLIAESAFIFHSNKPFWKPLIVAIIVVASVLLYGSVRLHQCDTAMKTASPEQWFTVGSVQPNIPIPVATERQPDPGAKDNNFYTAMEQASELAREHPEIDLIVLPENPETFLFNEDMARRQALGKLINEIHKPVMLNADAIDTAKAGEDIHQRYNVSLLMKADRNLGSSYAKIKRIPLVEYLPGETTFPFLRKLFPKSQRVLAGTGPVLFEVKPGIHLIPLICYEGTFSGLTREFIRHGGNVIVNQVNDSWFLRTPASETHLALTLFRSVEFRVPIVRVTNSGIGAHIQATGCIEDGSRTELFKKAETAFPLYVPTQRSVYATIGNWWMLAFVFLFFSIGDSARRKSAGV